MNKAELVDAVQKNLGENFTKKQAEGAVASVLNAIKSGLQTDEKVLILGFGTFAVKEREARQGRNPKTGEKMTIPASKTVSFKASSVMKENC